MITHLHGFCTVLSYFCTFHAVTFLKTCLSFVRYVDLVAKGVVVGYGGRVVLKGVELCFNAGLYFIVGLNGCGKSTLLRVLAGVLSPWRGDVLIDGISIFRNPRVKKRIGYMPHDVGLLPELTVRENFILYAELMGIDDRQYLRKRIDELCELFNLWDLLNRKVNELSHGQKIRVGIARTLIHDPDIVILDEPTTGLDPYHVAEIRRVLQELAREKIVVVTTHLLSDIEHCLHKRLVLMHEGQVVFEGTYSDLVSKYRPKRRYILKMRGEPTKILQELGVEYAQRGEQYIVELGESVDEIALVKNLVDNGIIVEEIREDSEYTLRNIIEKIKKVK